jgi:hypothetical protein
MNVYLTRLPYPPNQQIIDFYYNMHEITANHHYCVFYMEIRKHDKIMVYQNTMLSLYNPEELCKPVIYKVGMVLHSAPEKLAIMELL